VYVPLVEAAIDEIGNRALAAPRKAGEPDDATLMPVELLALRAGDARFMPDDVRLGHCDTLREETGQRYLRIFAGWPKIRRIV
jgi:hypothetical protein